MRLQGHTISFIPILSNRNVSLSHWVFSMHKTIFSFLVFKIPRTFESSSCSKKPSELKASNILL